MENSYIEALRIQLKNSAKPGINFYLNWIYQLISREFEKDSEILEIGAGAGISSKYLHGLNVLWIACITCAVLLMELLK